MLLIYECQDRISEGGMFRLTTNSYMYCLKVLAIREDPALTGLWSKISSDIGRNLFGCVGREWRFQSAEFVCQFTVLSL